MRNSRVLLQLKADAQNVFETISNDKIKIQTFCEIADLSNQLDQADRVHDTKKWARCRMHVGHNRFEPGKIERAKLLPFGGHHQRLDDRLVLALLAPVHTAAEARLWVIARWDGDKNRWRLAGAPREGDVPLVDVKITSWRELLPAPMCVNIVNV
jgi:hypothetical protein